MISRSHLLLTISSTLFLAISSSLAHAQTEDGTSINLSDVPETPPTYLSSDLNQNGLVDIYDYNIFVSNYGYQNSPIAGPADINQDGIVDIYDYNILVAEYGMSYIPEPIVIEAPNLFRSPPPETTDPIILPTDAIVK